MWSTARILLVLTYVSISLCCNDTYFSECPTTQYDVNIGETLNLPCITSVDVALSLDTNQDVCAWRYFNKEENEWRSITLPTIDLNYRRVKETSRDCSLQIANVQAKDATKWRCCPLFTTQICSPSAAIILQERSKVKSATTQASAKRDTTTVKTIIPTTRGIVPTTKIIPTRKIVPTRRIVPTTRRIVPTTRRIVPTTRRIVPTTRRIAPTTRRIIPTTIKIPIFQAEEQPEDDDNQLSLWDNPIFTFFGNIQQTIRNTANQITSFLFTSDDED